MRLTISPLLAAFLLIQTAESFAVEMTKERRGRLVCAALDVHIVVAIEEAGVSEETDGQALFDAWLKVIGARDLCAAGRYDEAAQIYERIQISPPPFALSRQGQ